MSALTTYQRVVLKGTGPSSEIWQTGFWTESVTPPSTQAQLQTDCNAIAAFCTTFYNSLKPTIYSAYAFTEVDMYQYVYPGSTATLQAQTILTPNAGGKATAGSPIDTCIVASIRSSVPGRSNRGRMYLPYHDTISATTGMLSAATNNTYGTAVKTLFTSVAGYAGYVPVVVSRTHGTWQPVSSIVTDNKPDVQRRRENRLLPTATQVLAFP